MFVILVGRGCGALGFSVVVADVAIAMSAIESVLEGKLELELWAGNCEADGFE